MDMRRHNIHSLDTKDPRLIGKYQPAIRKTPNCQSGTQEAQLLARTIRQVLGYGKVIERRTLSIASELKSNSWLTRLISSSAVSNFAQLQAKLFS
jgi:hypothetical protein